MVRKYECSGCGGELTYKPGTNEAICARCGKKVLISKLDVDLAQGIFAGKLGPESTDTSGAGSTAGAIKCPSCGATIPTDVYTSASVCKYCQSPILIESQLVADYKPSRIVPFSIDKKEAQKKFRDWSKKGTLTPNEFKSNAIMDKVKGVYVPFWLYNYDVNVEMIASCENKRTTREGNVERETTETYSVERSTHGEFDMVPQSASLNIPAGQMRIVEPFDYEKMTAFSMPYLSGFEAEKYARTDADMREEVKEELREVAFSKTEDTITGYDSVHVETKNAAFTKEQTEYVLMPVYTLDYTFHGKKYPIYMNGQTGKIAGSLPTDKLKAFLLFVIATLIPFTICAFISLAFIHEWNFGGAFSKSWIWGIIALIIGGIALLIGKGNQSGFGAFGRAAYLDGGKMQVLSASDRLLKTTTKARTLEEKK